MREQPSPAELVALGEQIAEQAVHLAAARHRLLADLRRFDEAGGWLAQHFTSCAHWLSHRVGWDLATSREQVRVARSLAALPAVDAALAAGKLSYSKTRAITRVATQVNEPVLLQYAEVSTASQLETICRKLHAATRLESDPRQALPRDDDRYVVSAPTVAGLVCVKAFLLPDEAALLMQVIQQAARDCKGAAAACEREEGSGTSPSSLDESAEACAASHHAPAETPSGARPEGRKLNRADGLMAMVHAYARGGSVHRSPIEMIVTTPAEALRVAAGSVGAHIAIAAPAGAHIAIAAPAAPHDRGASIPVAIVAETRSYLSSDTARRLACDCGLVEATVDAQGQPLSVGRKTRTIPAAIKRALLLRDRSCRFPGCDHRLFLDGHHLQHWADGGETSLSNTLLLCSAHHARVHEHGYRIVASPSGDLTFLDSRGQPVVAVPPRPTPSDLGWPAIRAANAVHSPLPLSADTSIDVARVAEHHVRVPATASQAAVPRWRNEAFAEPDYDVVAAGQRADDLIEWSMEALRATGVDPRATVPLPIWPPPSWYQSKQREVPGPAWAPPPVRRARARKARSKAASHPRI